MHGTMIMAEKNLKSEPLNSCFPLTLPGWIAGENSSMNWHALFYLPTTPATSHSCCLLCCWCCWSCCSAFCLKMLEEIKFQTLPISHRYDVEWRQSYHYGSIMIALPPPDLKLPVYGACMGMYVWCGCLDIGFCIVIFCTMEVGSRNCVLFLGSSFSNVCSWNGMKWNGFLQFKNLKGSWN